ncbi:hypothetical protein [Flavobacterium sp.]|uniref:hypothetical protein n=1 Tax=Flavobacterium sp. TaxID=239 RepID=UPI003B9BAA84
MAKIIRFICLFAIILQFSCSVDNDIIREDEAQFMIRRMDFSSLSLFPKAKTTVGKFPELNQMLLQNEYQQRNAINTGFGFSIDTDDFLFIGTDEKHSLTFKVIRSEAENSSKTENLVLKKLDNGEYATFLLRYDLSDDDKNNLLNGLPVDGMDGKTEISYLNEAQQRFTTFISVNCVNNYLYSDYQEFELPDGRIGWVNVDYFSIDCTWTVQTIGIADNEVGGNSGGGTPAPPGSVGGGSSGGGSSGNTSPPSSSGSTGGGGNTPSDNNPTDATNVINDENNPIQTLPLINDFTRDCNLVKKVNSINPAFKQKLLNIASPASLNLNYEQGVLLMKDNPTPVDIAGLPNAYGINITVPAGKLMFLAHNHPDDNTYSVFSLADLAGIARMLRQGRISVNNFVAYLATKKGTYLAITISDPEKLVNLLYSRTFNDDGTDIPADQWPKIVESEKNFDYLYKRYWKTENPSRLIQETDTDNENVLTQFLKFLRDADAGVNLFETDATFSNFKKLNLTNNNEIDRTQVCP